MSEIGKSILEYGSKMGGNTLLRIFITIILTQLINPEQMGLVAISTILLVTINICLDAAIPNMLMRYKGENLKRWTNSLQSFKILRGSSIALGILLIGTPLMAQFYDPQMWGLIPLASLQFLATSFQSLNPQILLMRGEHKKEANWEIKQRFIQLPILIGIAYLIPNAFGLLLGNLICASIQSWRSYRLIENEKFHFRVHPKDEKEIKDLFKRTMLSGFSSNGAQSLVVLLATRQIPIQDAAFFRIAQNITRIPITLWAKTSNSILLPIAQKYQNQREKAYNHYRIALLKYLSLYGIGITFLMVFCDFPIHWVYPPDYAPIAQLVPWAILAGIIHVLRKTYGLANCLKTNTTITTKGGLISLTIAGPITFLLTPNLGGLGLILGVLCFQIINWIYTAIHFKELIQLRDHLLILLGCALCYLLFALLRWQLLKSLPPGLS